MAQKKPKGECRVYRDPLISKEKSAQTRQAIRLAQWLQVFMGRIGQEDSAVKALIQELTEHETRLEQLGAARIEGRLNQKSSGGGNSYETIHLFVDESGSESLNADASVFVVAGVAFTESEISNYRSRADALKLKHLGDANITFHEPFLKRGQKEFSRLDASAHRSFVGEVLELYRQTEFTAFAVAIRKDVFLDFQTQHASDWLEGSIYDVAVGFLAERFVDYLCHLGRPVRGRIRFESIQSVPDAMRQRAYAELLIRGTQWVSRKSFLGSLETGCVFEPKCGSSPCEIADALARTTFEWITAGCSDKQIAWELFSPKFYARGDNRRGKFGLKVFPDDGLKNLVDDHRSENLKN